MAQGRIQACAQEYVRFGSPLMTDYGLIEMRTQSKTVNKRAKKLHNCARDPIGRTGYVATSSSDSFWLRTAFLRRVSRWRRRVIGFCRRAEELCKNGF